MKTLYLHIGTHKTGTTSLQNFLCSNNKIFQEEGAVYPRIKSCCKRVFLSTTQTINGSFLIEPSTNKNFALGLKTIKKLFKKFNKVIISEEFISYKILICKHVMKTFLN